MNHPLADQVDRLTAHVARLRGLHFRLRSIEESLHDLRAELTRIHLELDAIVASARSYADPRS